MPEFPCVILVGSALSDGSGSTEAGWRYAQVERSLKGYSHFVASRQGLYVVNEDAWQCLVDGQFFGLSLRDQFLYAFAGDTPRFPTRQGRIIRFPLDGERLGIGETVAKGLDNGCHQIDFINGRLQVVDTYQQQIIDFAADFSCYEIHHPMPQASNDGWAGGYVHCNSLLGLKDFRLLLLHNGGLKTRRPSRLLVCDNEWKPLRQTLLPGLGCHNLVLLEDGSLLSCGSLAGALIDMQGIRIKVDDCMTRGLAVDETGLVVGASHFAVRKKRQFVSGRVHFFNRDGTRRACLELPAAPKEIRRIDGQDRGLSDHARHGLGQYSLSSFTGRQWQPYSK